MPLPLLPLIGMFLNPTKILGWLSKFTGFIIKYWKQILFIAMAAAIFHQNVMTFEALKWVGVRTIPGIVVEYEYQIGVLTEQLDECERSRAELKGAIDATNAQIDKWSAVSSDLQKQHDDLVGQLKEMRHKSEQRVQDVLTGPTPQGCEAAMQYLRDAKEDLRWPGM